MNVDINLTALPAPTTTESLSGNSIDKQKYDEINFLVPASGFIADFRVILYIKRVNGGGCVYTSNEVVYQTGSVLKYTVKTQRIPDGEFNVTYTVMDAASNVNESLPLDVKYVTSSFQGVSLEDNANSFVKQWGTFNFYNSTPGSRKFVSNSGAIAIYDKAKDKFILEGDLNYGGFYSEYVKTLLETFPVTQMYSTQADFGALLDMGGGGGLFVPWGPNVNGETDIVGKFNNVESVYANKNCFVLLHKTPYQNKYWLTPLGNKDTGGDIPAELHLTLLSDKPVAVYSTYHAFAVLTTSGKVYTWGKEDEGGLIDAETASEMDTVKITNICATSRAFCAYTADGDFYSWGASDFGGNIPDDVIDKVYEDGGVQSVIAANSAFCAITKNTAKVLAWGDPKYGGEISESALKITERGGVIACTAGNTAFSVVNKRNNIVSWGSVEYSGNIKPKDDSNWKCQPISNKISSFVQNDDGSMLNLQANDSSFFLITQDSSGKTTEAIAWGDEETGGGGLSGFLQQIILYSQVYQIVSTNGAFCIVARLSDERYGLVVPWGRQADDIGAAPSTMSDRLEGGDIVYPASSMPPEISDLTVKSKSSIIATLASTPHEYLLWGGMVDGGEMVISV